jgi:hypothetical protein
MPIVLDFLLWAAAVVALFAVYCTCGVVLSQFWHTVLSLGHDHEPDDCEGCARLAAERRGHNRHT